MSWVGESAERKGQQQADFKLSRKYKGSKDGIYIWNKRDTEPQASPCFIMQNNRRLLQH